LIQEIRLNINGFEVVGLPGETILQVATANGIEIPTLCYDERTEIYGACGLCVVEVEGNNKLLRACATEIAPGMVVHTNTERVRGSRQMALELLLSDHLGDCRPPCHLTCPANLDVQGYVGLIANGNYRESLELIKEQLPLPAAIGRVCPHPCEDACRRKLVEESVSICWLKQFAADQDLNSGDVYLPEIAESTGKTVAIVGAGPAGLTAAYYLARAGHQVTIYEAMPHAGGMLRYGIPQYRLPKDVLDAEIDVITSMGVEIKTNTKIGRDVRFDYLKTNYDALYLAIGAWVSSGMRCSGEELEGVLGGIEFLCDVALNKTVKLGKRVAVIGGGNTAMDACRTAVRMGAEEVYLLYRRTKAEMPAAAIEIKEAEEEGVIFKFLVAPLEVVGENGHVSGIKVQRMELGEPDASGRRRPVPVEGSEEIIPLDNVIAAIGQSVVPDGMDGVALTKWNTIVADEATYMTNIPGVFAGGDAINEGPGIAIEAIGDARRAADVIDSYLKGEAIPYRKPYRCTREDLTEADFADREKVARPKMAHMSPAERKTNFQEIVHGYTEEQAELEAHRCLECGCGDVFECRLLRYADEYRVQPKRMAGEVHRRDVQDPHPFIDRNPDKCILCGLCSRICDEVMGVTALGLVDRGFDTVIEPEFNLPLGTSRCISCGQCVANCPTGALQERLQISKSVPLQTECTPTVCSFCSVGCNMKLETSGELLVKAVPDQESAVDNGLLCVKGRFGFNVSEKGDRLDIPMIKKDDWQMEVDWPAAILHAAKKAQGVASRYGAQSMAVAVSDRYTNEEIYLAKKLADQLGTDKIFSFNGFGKGIKDVLGYDASTNTFDEMLSANVILLVGSDVMADHTIAGLKIRQAVKNGAKLFTINDKCDLSREWAVDNIETEDSITVLRELLAAVVDKGAAPQNAQGFAELKESLASVIIRPEAKQAADEYLAAKNAFIVFDQNGITGEAAQLLADLAVVSGHIGRARNGIIQLKPKANSQGLVDMGVTGDPAAIKAAIADGSVKGLFIFGEDVPDLDVSGLEFLLVQDTHLTATAQKADVVLPAVSYAETEGTYTSSERRIQRLLQAVPTIPEMENWEVLESLANAFGAKLDYCCPDAIMTEIAAVVPEYRGVTEVSECDAFWPATGSPVLYGAGFHFADGQARLQIPADAPLFKTPVVTDHLEASFKAYLKEQKIG